MDKRHIKVTNDFYRSLHMQQLNEGSVGYQQPSLSATQLTTAIPFIPLSTPPFHLYRLLIIVHQSHFHIFISFHLPCFHQHSPSHLNFKFINFIYLLPTTSISQSTYIIILPTNYLFTQIIFFTTYYFIIFILSHFIQFTI